MKGPVATLGRLNGILLRLHDAQQTIDMVRRAYPQDSWVQLQMDRKQYELDEQLARVEFKMLDIASRN